MFGAVSALCHLRPRDGFDHDDESNGMAYITVSTVSRHQKYALKELDTDRFALFPVLLNNCILSLLLDSCKSSFFGIFNFACVAGHLYVF